MSRTVIVRSAVLIVALTACSGDSGADGTSSGGPDESPLPQYGLSSFAGLGAGMGGQPELRELTKQERRQLNQIEELVASCMADVGFEYRPIPVDDQPDIAVDDVYSLPPEEFAETYGYGITTLDHDEPEGDDTGPNKDIRDALSPSAQDAYDRALGGGAGEDGCRVQASTDVYESAQEQSFDALWADYSALLQRIQDDARLDEATAAWVNCMADQGYPGFEHGGSAMSSIMNRLYELQGLDPNAPPIEGEDDIVDLDRLAAALDPEALRQLREDEVALAQVEYACRDDHYAPVWRAVTYELEEEFAADHRAELEQFRDSQAESPGAGAGND